MNELDDLDEWAHRASAAHDAAAQAFARLWQRKRSAADPERSARVRHALCR